MGKTTILDSIYFSMNPKKYGLDMGVHGFPFDYTKTSGNLDFRVETYQTRFENVYFNCYLYDYKTEIKYHIGYFYFKDNKGEINWEMMSQMAEVIEKGNEITSRIFEEVA